MGTSNWEKSQNYLIKLLFKIELYSYQLEILKKIFKEKKKRLIICATTRAGKTLCLAIASILFALENPFKKVLIIAPTFDQSKILMNYIIQFLFKHKFVMSQIATRDLSSEVSKKKITFVNGATIEILSAQGDAERLLGMGGDMIICDESALIDDEIFRTRIWRMLGDNPNSILIEIGNPIKLNHFYEHWNDARFEKIKIDWKDCIKEGRLSKEFIEEQKSNLTEWEFRMLYDAEFVDIGEENIFSISAIERAKKKNFLFKSASIRLGVDVARFGRDFSVLTIVEKEGEKWKIKEIIALEKKGINELLGRIILLNEKYHFEHIIIDDTGIGGSITDMLRERDLPVIAFVSGASPRNKDRFANLKSETVFKLKELFDEDKIQILEDSRLIKELLNWKLKITSQGKIRIEDPKEKSPDFADSLMLAIYEDFPRQVVVSGKGLV